MSEQKQKKTAYDIQYARDNITRKFIPFNKTVESDAKMLAWLDKQGKRKVTKYIKGLIQKDMDRAGE